MKLIVVGAALAGAASLSACATVTRGTNTYWDVHTNPGGARVETSHGYTCASTPCSLKMPRKSAFQATITKPGYKTVVASVGNRVSGGGGGAAAGNILAGGIIGVGIDASSGAMLDLRPDPLLINLEQGEGTVTLNQTQAEDASAQAGFKMPKK